MARRKHRRSRGQYPVRGCGANEHYWNVLDAAGLGNSGLVVATGSSASIQLHIISATTHSDTSGPIPVALGTAYVAGSFDLTEMPSGHFIASWRDGTTLKAQQFDQSGHIVGAQMLVNAAAPTNFSMTSVVVASDPDGDPISFAARDPAHGSISGGSDGKFVYTPDAGFLGADSFTVTISDDHGETAQQAIAVTVSQAPSIDWRLLIADGLEASAGGDGQIFGTGGFEDITVLDVAGSVSREMTGPCITMPIRLM